MTCISEVNAFARINGECVRSPRSGGLAYIMLRNADITSTRDDVRLCYVQRCRVPSADVPFSDATATVDDALRGNPKHNSIIATTVDRRRQPPRRRRRRNESKSMCRFCITDARCKQYRARIPQLFDWLAGCLWPSPAFPTRPNRRALLDGWSTGGGVAGRGESQAVYGVANSSNWRLHGRTRRMAGKLTASAAAAWPASAFA